MPPCCGRERFGFGPPGRGEGGGGGVGTHRLFRRGSCHDAGAADLCRSCGGDNCCGPPAKPACSRRDGGRGQELPARHRAAILVTPRTSDPRRKTCVRASHLRRRSRTLQFASSQISCPHQQPPKPLLQMLWSRLMNSSACGPDWGATVVVTQLFTTGISVRARQFGVAAAR